jgi:hypothetical protein
MECISLGDKLLAVGKVRIKTGIPLFWRRDFHDLDGILFTGHKLGQKQPMKQQKPEVKNISQKM